MQVRNLGIISLKCTLSAQFNFAAVQINLIVKVSFAATWSSVQIIEIF